jgi:hypothetical protein
MEVLYGHSLAPLLGWESGWKMEKSEEGSMIISPKNKIKIKKDKRKCKFSIVIF